MIISSLLLAASKGDAFDFSSERQLWVTASAAADALPECVRQCECAADLLPGNRNSHLNPSIDSRDSTYKSCYIQKAFAQNAMASNDPGCRVADCDARWQQLVPVLAAMTCASDNEEGAWARSDPWRRSRALTTPTAMPPRRLIDQVARGLAAQCTLRPTKMPTRMPTKAPTKSPTVKNNFIEPCLVNPADPCPCPERGMRSATCMQAKGFAQAALRENDGSCTRTCSQEVIGILKATANRQCIQDGGAWDESDSVTAKVWGRNLRSKLDPRRLQQEDICAVEATPAPTPLPSKSPTPSPTKAPIPEGCKTGSTGGANGINRACTLPFTYKGVKYETCTDVDSSAGLWCSTKTDWWGQHVPGGGNYGDCVETRACPLACRTTGEAASPVPRTPCVFPFIFDGKTYTEQTGCAPEPGRPGGWCSTQTDLFDQHISGNWGYCNLEGCPQPNPVRVLSAASTPESSGGLVCALGEDNCFQLSRYADAACAQELAGPGGSAPLPPLRQTPGKCCSFTWAPEFAATGFVHRSQVLACDPATDTLRAAPCGSCSQSSQECMQYLPDGLEQQLALMGPGAPLPLIEVPLGQCVPVGADAGGQPVFGKFFGKCAGSANTFAKPPAVASYQCEPTGWLFNSGLPTIIMYSDEYATAADCRDACDRNTVSALYDVEGGAFDAATFTCNAYSWYEESWQRGGQSGRGRCRLLRFSQSQLDTYRPQQNFMNAVSCYCADESGCGGAVATPAPATPAPATSAPVSN